MTTITGADNIRRFQLVTQRAAVKLEKLGMTRRGPSLTSMLRKQYGMKRNATHDEVIARLNTDIEGIDHA